MSLPIAVGALFFGAALYILYAVFRLPHGIAVGSYPRRHFRIRRIPVRQRSRQGKGSRALLVVTDLVYTVLAGAALVIFDCGVLDGKMRYYHIALSILGYIGARLLLYRFLSRPIRYLISMLLDLLRAAFDLLLLPFYFLFVLICRRIYGTILIYVKDKQKRRRILKQSSLAFLPKDSGKLLR